MKYESTAKEISEALGVSKRAIIKRANKEKWPHRQESNNRGGGTKLIFNIRDLPGDIQKGLIGQMRMSDIQAEDLEDLAPEAQLEWHRKMVPMEQFSFSSPARRMLLDPQHKLFPAGPQIEPKPLGPDVFEDDRVGDLAQIIREAEQVPPGYKKSKWIDMLAIKYDVDRSTIYRNLKKHDQAGLAGLKHRKRSRGQAQSWTPEAIDFWVGLCLKREHRKISQKALYYDCLLYEAAKRDWQIGSYRSALWWFNKRVTPQLLALQRGGMRALDNTLPPICRDYSDLQPFEILVGDQHRFDFWVMDEETGAVFRPEGYFWQDLRTRCLYGGALDKNYDSYLMGLALRIGLRKFGAFGSVYTDHGKPEESKYIAGILKTMRTFSLGIEETVDIPVDASAADPEEMICRIMLPGDHRKAIVRNAKAKMIESTNRALENILRNQLRLPGYVKRLTAPQEEQEIDHKEAQRLALAGKLATFREFILAVYRAMDFYNSEKPHRGVLREWLWDPKPKQASPMQCLEMCCNRDGWRPRRLAEDAIEMAFLPRVPRGRVVDRGRIAFRNERYEHEALMGLNGRRVEVLFDPLDPSWILVLHGDEFLCRAEPIEYSSMKDRDLAERKIKEKAGYRKIFLEEYRQLTLSAPDLRQYSQLPAAEKAAAIIGKGKREALKRAEEEAESYRELTQEELAERVKQITEYKPARHMPAFCTDRDRYGYLLESLAAGETVSEEDGIWMGQYEATWNDETKRYWSICKGVLEATSPREGRKS